ncbi:hypothetical protein A2U01_0073042, partial [Trifolium medium]|nr:hypothetical protein [Trifolium medium]
APATPSEQKQKVFSHLARPSELVSLSDSQRLPARIHTMTAG